MYQLWASCSHLHVTVIQQYNLVPVSKTGKVTLGGPTKSRPQPSGRRPDAVRVGWDSNPCKTVLIPVKQTEPPNRVLQQLADCKNGNKKNQIRLYGFFLLLTDIEYVLNNWNRYTGLSVVTVGCWLELSFKKLPKICA